MTFRPPPSERFTYWYRCDACGEQIEFVIELPRDMLEHYDPFNRCPKRGRLVFERKAPREAASAQPAPKTGDSERRLTGEAPDDAVGPVSLGRDGGERPAS